MATNIMDIAKYGQEQFLLGQEQGRERQLSKLSSGVISGDPQAYAQAAAIDPQRANQYQQAGDNIAVRARGAAKFLQTALQSGNQQFATMARHSIKPFMDTMIPGGYRMDMDANEELSGIDAFLAKTAHLEEGYGRPQVLPAGAGLVDATGKNLYTQPTEQPQPKVQLVQGGDGQMHAVTIAPNGSITSNPLEGLNSRVPRAGQSSTREGVTQAQGNMPSGHQFVGDSTPGPIPGGPYAVSRPSKEESIRGENERGGGENYATYNLSRSISAQKEILRSGLERIRKRLDELNGTYINTGPIDQYFQHFTDAGSGLEKDVEDLKSTITTLTRSPDIGHLLDLQAWASQLQYPSLNMEPQQNVETLKKLREFAEHLLRASQISEQDDASAGLDDLLSKYGTN